MRALIGGIFWTANQNAFQQAYLKPTLKFLIWSTPAVHLHFYKELHWGSGCGSVGRAVASDTRGPRFESSHIIYIEHSFSVNCIEKTKIKLKEAGNGPFFKKRSSVECLSSPCSTVPPSVSGCPGSMQWVKVNDKKFNINSEINVYDELFNFY